MPEIFTPNLETNPPTTLDHHVRTRRPVGMFTTFAECPSGVRFEHQGEDEEILLFIRQHFITNFSWIVISLILILLPVVLVPILITGIDLQFSIPENYSFVILSFYYVILFGYILINFLHWFYNIGIVTRRNVIDIDYSEIVNVHVAATKSSQIEDVSYKQNGFFKTLFNFGDVMVQTAANNPNFEFLKVPTPGKVVDIIHELIGTKYA